jgi:hypothetical protein
MRGLVRGPEDGGAADILRDVMWRGTRLAGIGITIGVALRPILVGLISLLASFVPARRAIIVNPLVAHRIE